MNAFRNTLIIFLSSISFSLLGQDVIVKKNGEEISCKVTEINDESVRYTLKTNKDLAFVAKLSDILMITFSNGEKFIPSISKVSNEVIPTGTRILLEVKRLISAKTATVGEAFDVVVKADVFDPTGKTLLFKAGTKAFGTVTSVTKNKSLGRAGTIAISVDVVKAVDGIEVPVSLNFSETGEDRSGAAIGVGALLFWPALFLKGEAPEVPPGTILTAETMSDHTLGQN